MNALAGKVFNKTKKTAKGIARLRMLPLYAQSFLKTAPQKKPAVYIIEDANWSIKWDGVHITRALKNLGRKASIDISPAFHANSILHFGSSYVFETQAFGPFTRNNKIAVTFFHGQYGDGSGVDKVLDLLRENITRIDAVAVANTLMKERFIKMGIPKQKLFLVPIGVDLDIFRPLSEEQKQKRRAAMNIPDDAFVIGSFQKDGHGWGEGSEPKLIKGPDIFLETMQKLAKNHKVFCLLSGPARGYVKAGLDNLGISYHHEFFENPDDVLPLYQVLDAYAVTSREEGGPKAIMESLACGVPLVTTKVGMAEDVLNGHDCGFICEVEDTESLAASLEKIATDQALTNTLRKNGLERVKSYSWAQVALACEAMYKAIDNESR